jgi:hypothetical protein
MRDRVQRGASSEFASQEYPGSVVNRTSSIGIPTVK